MSAFPTVTSAGYNNITRELNQSITFRHINHHTLTAIQPPLAEGFVNQDGGRNRYV